MIVCSSFVNYAALLPADLTIFSIGTSFTVNVLMDTLVNAGLTYRVVDSCIQSCVPAFITPSPSPVPPLSIYRQSVCMWVQVTLRVCALKDGQVTARCVWRSITVSWIVEEAAAPTPTVTTLDLDRSVTNN